MISKICFVVFLGCALARANPVVSKFELAHSEGPTINEGIEKMRKETAAITAIGIGISNDVIEAIIKTLVEALPGAINAAISKQLALPEFKIPEKLRELVENATRTVTRELERIVFNVNRITKVPNQVLVATTAALSASPLG